LSPITALRRTAKIKTHLVALTVHFATDRLTALAQAQGVIVKTVPEVLFVCVHNAGRSQMAAALLHHHAAGTVHVRSAGSAPVDEINPAVHEAMAEIGLDISHEFPKPLTDDVVQAADVVITMGCGDACPIYPAKRYLNWELDDPAGKTRRAHPRHRPVGAPGVPVRVTRCERRTEQGRFSETSHCRSKIEKWSRRSPRS
jgi:arsenate reductase (thioredoxin)